MVLIKKGSAALLACLMLASAFTFSVYAQAAQSIPLSFSSDIAVAGQAFSCRVGLLSSEVKSGKTTIRYNPEVLEYQSVAVQTNARLLGMSVEPTLVKEGELVLHFTCELKTETTKEQNFFDVIFIVSSNGGYLRLDLRAEDFVLQNGKTVTTNNVAETVATKSYPKEKTEIGYQRHDDFIFSDWGIVLPKPMTLDELTEEYGLHYTEAEPMSYSEEGESGAAYLLLKIDGRVVDSAAFTLIGDGNRDGIITAADARLTLRASAGIEYEPFGLCDVNFDGKITAADARSILRVSAGLDQYETWHKAFVKAQYSKYDVNQIHAFPTGENVAFTQKDVQGLFSDFNNFDDVDGFKMYGFYVLSNPSYLVNSYTNVSKNPFVFCVESKDELLGLYQFYETIVPAWLEYLNEDLLFIEEELAKDKELLLSQKDQPDPDLQEYVASTEQYIPQLKKEIEQLKQFNLSDILKEYDDDYFKTKVLLIVNGSLYDSDGEILLDAIKKDENTLQFCLTKPYSTGDSIYGFALYGLFAEVDKTALEGIEDFEYYLADATFNVPQADNLS
ncbi:MAG: dockerin type I repeat-containing protein [Oscillospiraceae bacterium]|jgi:hypothetical protein|nr:dockerin type I repeat-containing protein [Oscillospiraceae bacterium]